MRDEKGKFIKEEKSDFITQAKKIFEFIWLIYKFLPILLICLYLINTFELWFFFERMAFILKNGVKRDCKFICEPEKKMFGS
jgi:hypothetical protein